MTPRKIVEELDRYIVGQLKAKRAVAVALRNRMRRQRLPEDIRDEIAPKNILMIGPTGVGKTEIARRLAKLCGAPFIKIEATKYTEVGYVGRDVESMIRDLMAAGVAMVKTEMQAGVKEEAERRAEERLLDLLLPGIKSATEPVGATQATYIPMNPAGELKGTANGDTREKFRSLLRAGKLNEREVEITVQGGGPAIEIFSGNQMEEMEVALGGLGGLGGLFGGKRKKKSVSVAEARRILAAEELDKLVDPDRAAEEARHRVEETGIVFIDEIDRSPTARGGARGASMCRARASSATSCPSSRVPRSTPSGGRSTRHTFFLSPREPSTSRNRKTSSRSSRDAFPSASSSRLSRGRTSSASSPSPRMPLSHNIECCSQPKV